MSIVVSTLAFHYLPSQVNTDTYTYVMFPENVLCVPVLLHELVKGIARKKNALQVHFVPVINIAALCYGSVGVNIDNMQCKHLYWPQRALVILHVEPECR